MEVSETFTITYHGKEYIATDIPHIFINNLDESIIIAAHSLNVALYDDEKGYTDEKARYIDEKIYAFIDDDFFRLSKADFIEQCRRRLD